MTTIQNDNNAADVRGASERAKVLASIEAAQGKARAAMLEGPRMTVRYGLTSKDEVAKHWPSCNNPGVYAPNFNRGHKAAQVIGVDATLALIDSLAKLPGTAYDNVKAGLKVVMDEGKARAKAGKTGIATGKEARTISAKASAAGKALRESGNANRAPTTPTADTCLQFMADLTTLANRVTKLAAPEGREGAWAEMVKHIRLATEAATVAGK